MRITDLHAYQVRAAIFIENKKNCALWIDMGLGKTIATLSAVKSLLKREQVKKVLIIAPLRVARATWPTEIKAWDHTSKLTYTVLAGMAAKKRQLALWDDSQIHIINRENIPWLVQQLGQDWPYDMVVIDESTSFKTHSSKRWKSLKKVLGKIDRMVQLTGTPAPNSLLELWPQFYLLDQGERLFKTRTAFLQAYARQVGKPEWHQWEIKPEAVETIKNKVSDIVLRMSAADYLDVPKRIVMAHKVILPPKARRYYEDMKKDFLLQYEAGEIIAANAGAKAGKLLQICQGQVYYSDNELQLHAKKDYLILHQEKIEALKEIIENANAPVLVAYQFKSDVCELTQAIPGVTVLKDETQVDEWNKGTIPVLLAHPASAGHGLNLQYGGHILVWYGLTWSNEIYLQFNARLERQGQLQPVRIIHLITEETIEENVLESLRKKDNTQKKLLKVVTGLYNS